MNFEDLIAKVKTCGKQKLAVAAAEDDAVLEAVDAAHKQGIADAILVGDEAAIRKIAAELNIDLSLTMRSSTSLTRCRPPSRPSSWPTTAWPTCT